MREVRGSLWIGICNEAREQLLELCAVTNLTIMNTWFKKKAVHLGTWIHPLVKGSLLLGFPRMHRNGVTRVPLAVHLLRGQEVRDKYQQSLDHHLSRCQHTAEGSVEEQWQVLKDCIMTSAEEAIGHGWKKQPDWFVDAADVLESLLDDKVNICRHSVPLLRRSSDSVRE